MIVLVFVLFTEDYQSNAAIADLAVSVDGVVNFVLSHSGDSFMMLCCPRYTVAELVHDEPKEHQQVPITIELV